MNEQADKIEGQCNCGSCNYYGTSWHRLTVLRTQHYCDVCGYYLAPDGFAYRMVRADALETELAEAGARWSKQNKQQIAYGYLQHMAQSLYDDGRKHDRRIVQKVCCLVREYEARDYGNK